MNRIIAFLLLAVCVSAQEVNPFWKKGMVPSGGSTVVSGGALPPCTISTSTDTCTITHNLGLSSPYMLPGSMCYEGTTPVPPANFVGSTANAMVFNLSGNPSATVHCYSGVGEQGPAGADGEGTPGGTDGQIQVNNGGAFGGLNSTGTDEVVRATSPTVTTPTLINPLVVDPSDNTKGVRVVVSGVTTGTVRNVTIPDYDVTLGTIGVQNNAGTDFMATVRKLRFQNGSGAAWTLTDLGSNILGASLGIDTTGLLTLSGTQTAQNKTLDSTNTATAGLVKDGCSDAGSTDTYACSLSPAITGYVTGTRYRFKANTANTGAATINLSSVGATTIKKLAGGVTTDLDDNDIRAGQWVEVVYDGTNMQMVSQLGNSSTADPDTVTAAGTLTSNAPMIGAGSKAAAVGSRSGNTTEFATVSGTKTTGKQLQFDADGNIEASATDIGAGGSLPDFRQRWTCTEEMFALAVSARMNCGLTAAVTNSGNISFANAATDAPGQALMSTTTSATGTARVISWDTSSLLFGGGTYTVETRFKTPAALSDGTDTYTIYSGFGDEGAGSPTEACLFRYSHSISANWQILCTTAGLGSATTADSGVAVAADTWYKLRVVVNADGTSAEFFINGASVGTISATMPNGATDYTGVVTSIVKSAGTSSRFIYIDYLHQDINLTAAR